MRFDKLIIDNFLTYRHEEYDFVNRPLLIQGLNLTEEDQKSNGSGKSGLQTAIEFCITASNSRGVRDMELVSYGFKESRVQLFASCDVRKKSLHIDWTIRVKGSNSLVLKDKDYGSEIWEDVSFSNVNDGKKEILEWFALTSEDLFNYFIINNARFKSFFKSSQKENVDLINRFSDASILDGVDKVDVSELEKEYSYLRDRISEINGQIELQEKKLSTEKERDLKSELQEEILELREGIDDIKHEIARSKDKITDFKDDLEDCDTDISKLEVKRLHLLETSQKSQKDYDDHSKTLESIKDDLKKAQGIVDSFKDSNWTEIKSGTEKTLKKEVLAISEEEAKIKELDEKKQKVLKLLNSIEIKLSGVITCPNCKHEFLLDGSEDLEDLKSKKIQAGVIGKKIDSTSDAHRIAIEETEKIISVLRDTISDFNKKEKEENDKKNELVKAVNLVQQRLNGADSELVIKLGRINSIKSEIDKCIKEVSDIDTEKKEILLSISKTEGDIKSKEKDIKDLEIEIKNLKPDDNSKIIKELKKEIKELKEDKSEVEEEHTEVGDKIYERNQWSNNFKNFRMHVANQSLEAMEFQNNMYLKGMGSDLRIRLDRFKTLANGTTKDEITATIIRDTERTFSSFSGGERGRLLFASILANRYLINSTHKYGGLDFLSIDEVFEGIDGLGLRKIINSAKTLGIAVMIITHVTDEDVSEDILRIEKVNGVSKIIKN